MELITTFMYLDPCDRINRARDQRKRRDVNYWRLRDELRRDPCLKRSQKDV